MKRRNRRNQRLFLTADTIMQFAGDPAFYANCAGFLDLRESGMTATAARHVGTCDRCGTLSVMMPVVNSIKLRVAALKQTGNTDALEQFRSYLAGRLGYRPVPLVIHLPKTPAGGKRTVDF
jgi:hypothetical protein